MSDEDDPKTRTIFLDSIKGDIKFEDVSFSYEDGKEVLHNIEIDAPAGTVTALVGSSGSGKSTIAGLASTFLNPNYGESEDGQNIYRRTRSFQNKSKKF